MTLRDDRGAGTVLGLALVGAAVAVLLALGALGGAQSARGHAQAGADLAALAAADLLVTAALAGAPTTHEVTVACERARVVARANRAELAGCEAGADGVVVVRTRRAVGPGVARAVARAGPESARARLLDRDSQPGR